MKESGGGRLELRQSPEDIEMRLTFKGDNAKGKSERVTRSCSNIVTKVCMYDMPNQVGYSRPRTGCHQSISR